ncbi:MAG TPA: hypothetical protein VGT81_06755, partial [Casimicrobiaceae bacterium]|nr:hypothetical protein [Casimicrobiaceae bacterium]
ERAGPAGRPAGAAAAPRRPTRSLVAAAAADVADFCFADELAGRAMALGRSGRAIMRPERGASYRVCFAIHAHRSS